MFSTSPLFARAWRGAQEEERRALGLRKDVGSAYVHSTLMCAQRLLALEKLSARWHASNCSLQEELTVHKTRTKSMQDEMNMLRDALMDSSSVRAHPPACPARFAGEGACLL